MDAIVCPYCGEVNHTSSPEAMAECAYCLRRFAQVDTETQSLVILDRGVENVWQIAEGLMARWQESGQLEKEVVIDRRYDGERHPGGERRLHGVMSKLQG